MRIDVESSFHAGKAMELFLDGYNCAQSVFTAFCDLHGMEEKEALRLSSSFGGGMGRMREVCGALSGIFMAAGLLYGYDSPDDKDAKTEHYRRIIGSSESCHIPAPVVKSCCNVRSIMFLVIHIDNRIRSNMSFVSPFSSHNSWKKC